MRISKLEVENILSIGHIQISFGESGLVLLDGWNHDDNSHNGAGKTSIFNALSFALFNKLPRKVTASEILRKGCKSGYSKVEVKVGDDILEITRSRPTNLSVSKNGQLLPTLEQEQLESMLGLTYEQFLICMYSSQTESVKLLSLNDSSKKDFFLRLLNLEDFADKKRVVDSILKTKTSELSSLELSKAEIEAKVSAYSDYKINKQDLVDKLDTLKQERESLNTEFLKLSNIQKPDLSKFDELESRLNSKMDNILSLESKIQTARVMVKRLDTSIANFSSNAVNCPHCDGVISIGKDGATTIELLEEERKVYVTEINTYSPVVDQKASILDSLSKLKVKKADALSEYTETVSLKNQMKSSIALKDSLISQTQKELDICIKAESKIDAAKVSLKEVSNSIASIKQDLLLYEAIASALSPTGAPAYVIDSLIDRFNDKVSQYVSLVWPNATYSLQSFKENKSGDIKAKFSDKLTIQGVDRSIGSLSGGEMRCLSLAVDMAIIDVVETMFGISMNPIVLDEPFEGLDSLNRERVIEVLESVSSDRQIWIVDHASEAKSMFSNIVKVEKRDGISSIV